jgi:hypothetical protein
MKTNRQRKTEQTLGFEDAARFNWVLDTNETLQDGLAELAAQLPHLTEEDYTARLLRLLHNAGLDITIEEFKTLLALRRQLDQRLLCEKDNIVQQNKLPGK